MKCFTLKPGTVTHFHSLSFCGVTNTNTLLSAVLQGGLAQLGAAHGAGVLGDVQCGVAHFRLRLIQLDLRGRAVHESGEVSRKRRGRRELWDGALQPGRQSVPLRGVCGRGDRRAGVLPGEATVREGREGVQQTIQVTRVTAHTQRV